jgi:hypothetical protein
VIDEVGAMQMLVPPHKRKKTITVKEIEQVISTIAGSRRRASRPTTRRRWSISTAI